MHFTEWGHTTYGGNASSGWSPCGIPPLPIRTEYGVIANEESASRAWLSPKTCKPKRSCKRLGFSKAGISLIPPRSTRCSTRSAVSMKEEVWPGEKADAAQAGPTGSRPASPTGPISARLHLTNIVGEAGNLGVDVHIAAKGVSGTFKTGKLSPATCMNSCYAAMLSTAAAMRLNDFGGAGDGTLEGGGGYDRLYGGPGNDSLSGGNGADKLKGDAGDDIFRAGRGLITLSLPLTQKAAALLVRPLPTSIPPRTQAADHRQLQLCRPLQRGALSATCHQKPRMACVLNTPTTAPLSR